MNPEADSHLVLEVKDLTKCFGDFIANDNITFDVRKGDIHCLLGENGAGKSTLAKCIYGASKPDSGSICFKGKEVSFSSPRDAINMGIGMVIICSPEKVDHLTKALPEAKVIGEITEQKGETRVVIK